jgi:hypothetical protein
MGGHMLWFAATGNFPALIEPELKYIHRLSPKYAGCGIKALQGKANRFGTPYFGVDSHRHLLVGVRCLTRIESRSVKQVVDLNSTDEFCNWPVIYGIEVGHW